MEILSQILFCLPPKVVDIIEEKNYQDINELRFCLDKPVLINTGGKTRLFTDKNGKEYIAGNDVFEYILHKITGGSMYSVGNNINEGFVTLKGGHRVGVCGTCVMQDGKISHIRHISALCFRVSREVKGCALFIADEIESDSTVNNILIASPPGCGKTTILRDLCRVISNGEISGVIRRVGVADERREIAAVVDGKPTFDIGVGAFVCDGYPKAIAMNLMLRSMTPEVILTDEIGTAEDFDALRNARKSGVSIIASAHAGNLADLRRRYYDEISIFDKIIFLKDKGKISRIYRRNANDY